MLVADSRKEDTDFYYWLNVVQLLSDNSPLIIVKNEKQDRQRDINERQLRGEFINLKETLATNLATCRGLPEVLTQVKSHIINLPHIGTELPKAWVKVREELEKDARNYMSLSEYLLICANNGIVRDEDKLQLSRYLHDLGVCLHFQDDELLIKSVILKPTWSTDAAYKVLDSSHVINNLGRFNRDDLNYIWHDEKYISMVPELLRLMMNFKLCYEIPRSQGNYISPQLLSPNPPEYDWDNSENLQIRYEYEFMPKGILTRFIVEMHELIENQVCVWKTGVVLSKDKARAEIVEIYRYHKGEIHVRISGNRPRDLLTLIRHEFDKIHGTYERLNFSTLVPCNCSICKFSNPRSFYPLDELYKFLDANQQIQCRNSFQMVNVRDLVDKSYISYLENDQYYGRLPYSDLSQHDWANKYSLAKSYPQNSLKYRYKKKYDALFNDWELVQKKLSKLNQAFIIEADEDKKFKLQQKIDDLEKKIDALDKQLKGLEEKLEGSISHLEHL